MKSDSFGINDGWAKCPHCGILISKKEMGVSIWSVLTATRDSAGMKRLKRRIKSAMPEYQMEKYIFGGDLVISSLCQGLASDIVRVGRGECGGVGKEASS